MSIWYRKPSTISMPMFKHYEDVEEFMNSSFKNGYPVLVSSGRAAISLLIKLFWESPHISIFKYASQCVVKACLASNVTPSTSLFSRDDIVYHQWGYKKSSTKAEIFIEDSCDTFLPVNSSVRTGNSRFEIWSLPKILGIRSGAIIWCKFQKDAEQIKLSRNHGAKINFKFFLKFLGQFNIDFYHIWEKNEFKNCTLNLIQIGYIYKNVCEWNQLYLRKSEMLIKTISQIRTSGYKGEIIGEDEILKMKIAPVVLVGDLELNKFCVPLNRLHYIDEYGAVRLVSVLLPFARIKF
jgi:putative PLP-dependent aminotransferase (TIGR04422 family)